MHGKIDMATSIWGSTKFIDALVWMVRSYRQSGNPCEYVHVGCPKRFQYEGIDLEGELGIIQYPSLNPPPATCPIPRWHLMPQLPPDKSYFISEVDIVFQSPVDFTTKTGNIISTGTWTRAIDNKPIIRMNGFAEMSLLKGADYNRIMSFVQGFSFLASVVGKDDYFRKHRKTIFENNFSNMDNVIKTNYYGTLDEDVFSDSISYAQTHWGFEFDERPFCWEGDYVIYNPSKRHSYSNHVEIATQRLPGLSPCHIVGGEDVYEGQSKGSWID